MVAILTGCGGPEAANVPNVNAPTKDAPKPSGKLSPTEQAALSFPNQSKGGKLETKVLPRGATEVVATVKPGDLDKALACLKAQNIETKTAKEGAFVDVIVNQKDSDNAGRLLLADATEKGYDLHAGSAIHPDMPK